MPPSDHEEPEPEPVQSEEPEERPRQQSARKYGTPEFLSELDLTAGEGWKNFAERHLPQKDNEKYLLAALWLTEEAGFHTFTPDHIFTCFRAMGWREQKDFWQPIRLMKSKRSYFESPSRGVWKLTAGAGIPAARAIKTTNTD